MSRNARSRACKRRRCGTLYFGSMPGRGHRQIVRPEALKTLIGKPCITIAGQAVLVPEEITLQPSASVQAIRDAVANLDDVSFVAVRENDKDFTDAEGLPPHSFRVTVLGGDDAEIAIDFQRPVGGAP